MAEKNPPGNKRFHELFFYTLCGGVATVFDWLTYAISTDGIHLPPGLPQITLPGLGLHHLPSVILAYTVGGVVNYTLNKIITFKDRVKMIGAQMGIYIVIMAIAYGLNLLLMLFMVDFLGWEDFISRMITTAIVFVYNFLMHRGFTFNKNFHAKLNIR